MSGHGGSKDLWIDEFEVDEVQEVNGDPWPTIFVHRWQVNGIGERRFVETRRYVRRPSDDNSDDSPQSAESRGGSK